MSNSPRNIIISAYPKSGSVWLSRLTAELVGCPFAGFWNLKNSPGFTEGTNRTSRYKCYQAHHHFSELECNLETDKIICLVRDPRDIVISAAHHFNVGYKPIDQLMRLLPKGKKLNDYLKKRLTPSFDNRVNRMIDMVLQGDVTVSKWCEASWKFHCQSFIGQNAIIVQYENVLQDPQFAAKRILNFLEVERSEDEIKQAIHLQSFAKKKADLVKENNELFAKHLRQGRSNYWKTQLSKEQKNRFIESLRDELTYFNYELTG